MFEAYDQYLNGDAVVDMQAEAKEDGVHYQSGQTGPESSRPQRKRRIDHRPGLLHQTYHFLP